MRNNVEWFRYFIHYTPYSWILAVRLLVEKSERESVEKTPVKQNTSTTCPFDRISPSPYKHTDHTAKDKCSCDALQLSDYLSVRWSQDLLTKCCTRLSWTHSSLNSHLEGYQLTTHEEDKLQICALQFAHGLQSTLRPLVHICANISAPNFAHEDTHARASSCQLHTNHWRFTISAEYIPIDHKGLTQTTMTVSQPTLRYFRLHDSIQSIVKIQDLKNHKASAQNQATASVVGRAIGQRFVYLD